MDGYRQIWVGGDLDVDVDADRAGRTPPGWFRAKTIRAGIL